jgi:hypothetical protein
MSDFSNKTRNELERLEVDLKAAVSYFAKNAAKAEADLKEVTDALKALVADVATTVQDKAEAAVEVVKEEVKKAAPKKAAAKKADKKVEEAPVETPVEEPKAEEAPVEEPKTDK